ncbi:MAG: NAD-dependent deacylase [Opitutales bacterium]|nr:NAD-dependent deacylase [Opitutales bacterium]MCH8539700.1 NAD-dependent deacylase [Opitutales bacterium]
MEKPLCIVLSGSGISAESGIPTYRGAEGLWEGYPLEEIATPTAWERNPEKVLRFYNERRQKLRQVNPNTGHRALVDLEKTHQVEIITQNIDDLHERAGSTSIIHLHGELRKAQSSANPDWKTPLGDRDIHLGDLCPKGSQLRPAVVWFGEIVQGVAKAEALVNQADVLIVVGTSLQVYPAAGLAYVAPDHARKFVVDPNLDPQNLPPEFLVYQEPASTGLPKIVKTLQN